MIIAVAAAAGECIAEPETAIDCDLVGDIGEACCALVGRHHEIGIILVEPLHLRGWHDFALDDIVGHRQQGGNEDLVGFDSLGEKRVAVISRRQLLGKKATLRTGRYNHRIFNPLSFHQA